MSRWLLFLLALGFLLGALYLLRDWGKIGKRNQPPPQLPNDKERANSDKNTD